MTSSIAAMALAFISSMILTPVARSLGNYFDLVDRPDNHRKVHTKPIPNTGGHAIFVAFIIPTIALLKVSYTEISALLIASVYELSIVLLCAVIILIVGGIDDKINLRPRWKLISQMVVTTIAYFGGYSIQSVTVPFSSPLGLGIFSYFVTMFWFLGCINAINLLDGLDGLAAGVGLFVCFTLTLVSISYDRYYCVFLAASLGGSILGFLIYNFNPASIFLGDSGSMLIGFLIGALSLVGSSKAGTAVALTVPVIALGLPVIDTGLAILRRWSNRMPISGADRKHVHHVLISLGLSHRIAVLILYLICITFGGIALLITAGRNEIAFVCLSGLTILAVVFVKVFRILDLGKVQTRIRDDYQYTKRASQAISEVEKAISRMAVIDTVNDIWEIIFSSFEALEFNAAKLSFDINGENFNYSWKDNNPQDENGQNSDDMVSIKLKIGYENNTFGFLDLYKNDSEFKIRDTFILINRLRDEISQNIHRIKSSAETQRCWLFLKNMAHNGALKMFISCTESSHQIARTPVRQTPPV